MGPDELDNLATAGAGGNSALALYEGTREDDLVDEEIDDRILRLIGLEDVFDIDYGTYLTLLKERLAAARISGNSIPREEDELILNEFKRVKGKVGRFKIKSKKLSLDNIVARGPIRVDKNKFLLADRVKAVDAPEAKEGTDSKSIVLIEKTLDNIISILQKQDSERKKALEKDRQSKERESRKRKESLLEKSLGAIKTATQKILAPVQSIWDRIVNYLSNVILGFAATKLFDWLTDPKNKDKIQVIGRFLKDWWPALLGAFVLFATPFGKFIRGTIGLLRALLPRLINLIRLNPYASLVTAAAIGAAVKIKESERMKPLVDEKQKEIDKTLAGKETPWYQKLGASFAQQSLEAPGGPKNPMGLPTPSAMYNGGLVKKRAFFGGGQVDREVDVRDIAFAGGGGITDESGLRVKGAGPDTQLIAAAPGEVVMSKKAVDKYGANFFLGLNKNAGGTNIPKMVNNIQLAQGGGMVGKVAHHLKQDEALSSLTKGRNDFIKPGGRSVMSKINWGNIKPETPVHSYIDSVGQPTIGWCYTFYDSILSGKKPVKMGDSITKKQADGILNTNLGNLAKTYSQKIPFWKKMSDNQKAGVTLLGYNAPYGPIGAYPKLTASLKSGDMTTAAANVQRGGPNASRIAIERQLILSGPKNLAKVEVPKPPSSKPQNLFERIKTGVGKLFSSKQSASLGESPKISMDIPGPSSRRVSVINLPPQIEKVAMNPMRNAPAGTGVPSLSAEDPNFPYSASRAFYQGLTDLPVA
jgi:GH24 family phage-related lysozyme (muramidase)